MAFKMKGMNHGEGTGSVYKNVGKTGEYSESAAFQKDNDNKQKQFDKKTRDLRAAWRNLKSRNSNKAKQLQKEADKIGLTLDESISTETTHAGH